MAAAWGIDELELGADVEVAYAGRALGSAKVTGHDMYGLRNGRALQGVAWNRLRRGLRALLGSSGCKGLLLRLRIVPAASAAAAAPALDATLEGLPADFDSDEVRLLLSSCLCPSQPVPARLGL